jgi:hypothetical protein
MSLSPSFIVFPPVLLPFDGQSVLQNERKYDKQSIKNQSIFIRKSFFQCQTIRRRTIGDFSKRLSADFYDSVLFTGDDIVAKNYGAYK